MGGWVDLYVVGYISQQWQLASESEKHQAATNEAAPLTRAAHYNTLLIKTAHQYASTWFEWLWKETRGVWTCVRLQCTTHFGWDNMWTKVHRLEKFGLVIFSLAPKLSGLRRCILNQILNFHDYFFWGGTPVPVVVCGIKPWSISSACKKCEGAAPPKGRNVVSRKKYIMVYIH